jgi:hypothetical protein
VSIDVLAVTITAETCTRAERGRGEVYSCIIARAGLAAAKQFDPEVFSASVQLYRAGANDPRMVRFEVHSHANPRQLYENNDGALGEALNVWDNGGPPPPLGTYPFKKVA